MIDLSPYQLEIVLNILKKHVPRFEVRVFGSRYKWTAKDYSDLDLAIVGNKKLDTRTIYNLQEAFSESDLPIRVDVLDWYSISDEFKQIINQGYEVIQKKETQLPDGWVVKKLGDVVDVNPTEKLPKGGIVKKVAIPPLNEQKEIATILFSLDEKIDINKQINNKLEEIAQALFRQWFIDFNFPDENGIPYKDSGGAMIDSELGKIPKGWYLGTIGDYVKVKSGFAFKSQWWKTVGVKVVKIKDISNNTISFNELSHISIDKAIKASDFKVGFLYMILLQDNVVYQITARANGSAQANISPTDIESIKIVLPPKQIVDMFNLIVTPIFEFICRNINQNNKLQQIRDSLLPKLMSGEIGVCHSRVGGNDKHLHRK